MDRVGGRRMRQQWRAGCWLRTSRLGQRGPVVCLLWLAAAVGTAQTTPGVGVLRPKVEDNLNRLLDKAPPQYRAMMAATVGRMQQSMTEQMPGVVARTWVEMLQRKGIDASELDADSLEAGVIEAKVRTNRWLLSTSVKGDVKTAGGAAPMGGRGLMMSDGGSKQLSVDVSYAITDGLGHTLVPAGHAACSGTSSQDGGSDMAREDIWAACGDRLVAAVQGALPLGTVKYVDAYRALPQPPPMAQSLRLDVTVSAKTLYKGKPLPLGEDGPRKSILEFAGGSFTMEDRKMGIIHTAGDPRFFLVDDRRNEYSTMTIADFAFMRSFNPAGKNGGSAVKLVRTGETGKTVHYSAEAEGPGQTTTVDIEYGEPSPAWEHGVASMQALFSGTGQAPGIFGERGDDSVSDAIWAEIAASHAPPLRIKVETMEERKKKLEPVSEMEAVFDSSQIARPVDFTIPANYKWHTNMLLSFIWMQ